MRYVTFQPADAHVYVVAHAAIIVSAPPRTAGESRMLGKLLDKIEAIGVPQDAPHFKLGRAGGVLALEDAEYEVFLALAGAAPIQSHAIRDKIKLLDKVEGAPSTAPAD